MMTYPGMSPSQIILIKKKKKKDVDSSVLVKPFDWSSGFPTQHTSVWPVKAKYP